MKDKLWGIDLESRLEQEHTKYDNDDIKHRLCAFEFNASFNIILRDLCSHNESDNE